MAEYIEREAALQFVFDACAECMDACEEFDGIYADCNQCMLEGVKLGLRDLPAADVRPVVRGEWVQDCDYHFRCSVCGDRYVVSNGNPLDAANGWNFCPSCGAMMEES